MDAWRILTNPLSGETFTFVETSQETGGSRVVTLIELHPGGNAPRHAHPTHEVFECLDGHVTLHHEGREVRMSPGMTLAVQPQQLHGFVNHTDELATLRVTVTPAADFERTMRLLAGLAKDGRLVPGRPPKNPFLMANLAVRSGYYQAPLPRPAYWALMHAMAPFGRRACDAALERYDRPEPPAAASS